MPYISKSRVLRHELINMSEHAYMYNMYMQRDNIETSVLNLAVQR